MATAPKIHSADEAWESGELGRDGAHTKRAMDVDEKALDNAMKLELISVRLQRELIDALKLIAKTNGIGYQPLMRQALHRFVDFEMKRLLNDRIATRPEQTERSVAQPRRAAALRPRESPPRKRAA